MSDILFDAGRRRGDDHAEPARRAQQLHAADGRASCATRSSAWPRDDSLRAVVLTGAGRGFCAGQDLAEAMPSDGAMPDLGDIVRDSYNPVIRAIRTLEKPVICAVNGVAAGAGANLALRLRHRVRRGVGDVHSIVREDRRHSRQRRHVHPAAHRRAAPRRP